MKIEPSSLPRLAGHWRLRFDKLRDCWTVQGPERALLLDETAHAIVLRCDGRHTVLQVIDDLCCTYDDAPRDEVKGDVVELIKGLLESGVMAL